VRIARFFGIFISKKPILFVFALYLIVGVSVYWNLIFYGLASDEYRGLYMVKSIFTAPSVKSFKIFFSPYGGQFAVVSILNLFFGFEPAFYYLAGIVLRVIASTSVYVLGLKIFKVKTPSFIAGLFTLLAFGGLQSTWPINSNTYISISLTCLGFALWFDSLTAESKPVKAKALVAYLLFFLSFAVTPVRMHGLVPLVIIAELLALLLRKSSLKPIVLRLAIFLLGLYFLKRMGFLDAYGTAAGVTQTLLNPAYYLKIENPVGTFLFPLLTYARLIFPESILSGLFSLFRYLSQNKLIYFSILSSPAILFFMLMKKMKHPAILPPIFYIILTYLSIRYIPDTFSFERFQVIISVFILSFLVVDLLKSLRLKNKIQFLNKVVVYVWPLVFMLVPYLSWPFFQQQTESRYFTVSVVGISFVVGYLSQKKVFLLLSLIFLFFNIASSKEYITLWGKAGLYQKYVNEAFRVMNSEIGDRKDQPRPVVYIKGDGTEFSYLAIVEGGKERFSLLNDNLSENAQPYFVYSVDEFKDFYQGKSFLKTSGVENYFAFETKDKKVYSITRELREYLVR